MVLRKKFVDNSVRYIPKSEQTKEIKQNTTKNKKQSDKIQPISGGGKPNTRKQNKKNSQNNKKFLNNVSASGFKDFTKWYLYKYKNKYIIIHI